MMFFKQEEEVSDEKREKREMIFYILMLISLFSSVVIMQMRKNTLLVVFLFLLAFIFSRLANVNKKKIKKEIERKEYNKNKKISKKNYQYLAKTNQTQNNTSEEDWNFIEYCLKNNKYIPFELLKFERSKSDESKTKGN